MGDSSNMAGDNSSLQLAESDPSTIQSSKSQREQELKAMVDKWSIENTELKKSQKVALEAEKTLLKANKEMAEQMHLVQSQLVTVKDDIRQEFDQKFIHMFHMINLMQHPGIPLPSAIHSTPPRQATKTKASKNSIVSPVKKKVDNKGTPMQTNPFAADNPNRDRNMQQY